MLELFSGSCQMSNTFKKDGWKTISIDYNPKYKPDIVMNVYDLTPDKIKEICFGRFPDVIWLSPDCKTYSKASCKIHHNRITYKPIPVSEYAEYCDRNNTKLFSMIRKISETNDMLYFIENPQGYMRYMDFVNGIPRYTVTYCQYGLRIRKPTDIFTNCPNPRFKPCCKIKSKCHDPDGTRILRGSKLAYEVAKIPIELCEHIVKICDEYFER